MKTRSTRIKLDPLYPCLSKYYSYGVSMVRSLISNWDIYSSNSSFQSSYTARYMKIYDVTYNLSHIYRYIIYQIIRVSYYNYV